MHLRHSMLPRLQLALTPGYISALMMLAKNKAVPYPARLSGVTALRRAVMSHWHKDDPRATQAYSAEEKAVVREDIVATAVLQTELPLIKTFAEIAQVVFRHDYPDRWCVPQ